MANKYTVTITIEWSDGNDTQHRISNYLSDSKGEQNWQPFGDAQLFDECLEALKEQAIEDYANIVENSPKLIIDKHKIHGQKRVQWDRG